jgi:DNA-binding transcriptional regulator YiaG
MSSPTPTEIKAFRHAHGLSQRALALKLGCSRRAVEDWESGRREPMALLRLALERIAMQGRGVS